MHAIAVVRGSDRIAAYPNAVFFAENGLDYGYTMIMSRTPRLPNYANHPRKARKR
jgi:hypothetical protein